MQARGRGRYEDRKTQGENEILAIRFAWWLHW